MDFKVIATILAAGILLLTLGFLTAGILRREKGKKKIRRMGMPQKIQVLNELAEPFGFFYERREDVFTSGQDTWQRERGYEALYDRMATGMNMVLDAWPVYFDYRGRTWLIEFWKGQYGINTGGEVGVYHAKEIVPARFYPAAHFDAAEDDEMPHILCRLERRKKEVYTLWKYHWWLTGFRMGTFSRPSELRMMTTLTFQEPEMAQAFYEGLRATGQPPNKYRLCKNEVYVRMDFSEKVPFFPKIHRGLVQQLNRCYCLLFCLATRPFTNTVDRMLFLYDQTPSCFRRMLSLRKKCYSGRCRIRGKQGKCRGALEKEKRHGMS